MKNLSTTPGRTIFVLLHSVKIDEKFSCPKIYTSYFPLLVVLFPRINRTTYVQHFNTRSCPAICTLLIWTLRGARITHACWIYISKICWRLSLPHASKTKIKSITILTLKTCTYMVGNMSVQELNTRAKKLKWLDHLLRTYVSENERKKKKTPPVLSVHNTS